MMRYKDKTEEDGKGYSEREKENKEIKSKGGRERESRCEFGKTHDILNDTCAVVANKSRLCLSKVVCREFFITVATATATPGKRQGMPARAGVIGIRTCYGGPKSYSRQASNTLHFPSHQCALAYNLQLKLWALIRLEAQGLSPTDYE